MAPDSSRQTAVHPDAEIRSKAFLELRPGTRQKLTDLVGRSRTVYPRQPLPQMIAILFDGGKQAFGIFPAELSEFNPFGNGAPKHFVPPDAAL